MYQRPHQPAAGQHGRTRDPALDHRHHIPAPLDQQWRHGQNRLRRQLHQHDRHLTLALQPWGPALTPPTRCAAQISAAPTSSPASGRGGDGQPAPPLRRNREGRRRSRCSRRAVAGRWGFSSAYQPAPADPESTRAPAIYPSTLHHRRRPRGTAPRRRTARTGGPHAASEPAPPPAPTPPSPVSVLPFSAPVGAQVIPPQVMAPRGRGHPGSLAGARGRPPSGAVGPPASVAGPGIQRRATSDQTGKRRIIAGGGHRTILAGAQPTLLALAPLEPLRPPEKPDEPGRAAPLAGPESDPERDEAAVPRPGPPACPVAAARDGEVQVRALVVGAASDELAPRTVPCPGSPTGGFRKAGVVAATESLAPVAPVEPVPDEAEPVEVEPPPPPTRNGYHAIERFPNEDPLLDEVEVRGVGVGPVVEPATAPASSGSAIGVSGFTRRTGSPVCGISSVSSAPCAASSGWLGPDSRRRRPWGCARSGRRCPAHRA